MKKTIKSKLWQASLLFIILTTGIIGFFYGLNNQHNFGVPLIIASIFSGVLLIITSPKDATVKKWLKEEIK